MKYLLALVMWFALAGFDDAYSPPDSLAQAPTLPEGYDAAQALRLDLSTTLQMAMRHNLGIAVEREELKASELTARTAGWSLYEPTITGGWTHAPSGDTWSLGASSQLPTGGRVSVDTQTSRGPFASSSASISFVQPLLRGFSFDLDIPRYTILTARIASERERHELAINAANVIRETEAAYWDVVYGLYSYNVTLKSKQLAQDTVELVRRQIAAGLIASSDLIGAENTLAQRKIAVLTAAQNVEQSWDALRTIVHLPRDQWTRPLLPTDRPHFAPGATASIDVAFERAKQHRPELAQLALDREASQLALRKAKNDELPQIDLGFTGSIADPTPVGERPAGWSIVGTVTWTPFQRASKTATQLARIRHKTQAIGHEQRVQVIWNEVRAAVRGQQAAALEVVATAQSRKLAAATLAIETQKYLAGESSNLAVAQLQSGLASAELAELQALISHEKAEAGVLLSTGQLLAQRHIDLKLVR
jgi:outer membrane protein TolC